LLSQYVLSTATFGFPCAQRHADGFHASGQRTSLRLFSSATPSSAAAVFGDGAVEGAAGETARMWQS